MKKLFLLFTLLSFKQLLSQQFNSVEIGIDGLTCSMCTRTTEMNIRKLSFVENVVMDLSNTNGIITFKKGSVVSLYKIAKAVRDAGFSVRYLKAEFSFDSLKLGNEMCFTYKNEQYKYLGMESKNISGSAKLTLIGKEFMPPKEFSKWSSRTKTACAPDKKAYYVTI